MKKRLEGVPKARSLMESAGRALLPLKPAGESPSLPLLFLVFAGCKGKTDFSFLGKENPSSYLLCVSLSCDSHLLSHRTLLTLLGTTRVEVSPTPSSSLCPPVCVLQFNSVLTHLPRGSLRSHGLRSQSHKAASPTFPHPPHTHFRRQAEAQVVTCALAV